MPYTTTHIAQFSVSLCDTHVDGMVHVFPASPCSGLVQVSQCSSASEVSSLHLTFISQTSRFGSVQTAELEPGGATKEVTLDNRDEYLRKIVEYYMYGEWVHAGKVQREEVGCMPVNRKEDQEPVNGRENGL